MSITLENAAPPRTIHCRCKAPVPLDHAIGTLTARMNWNQQTLVMLDDLRRRVIEQPTPSMIVLRDIAHAIDEVQRVIDQLDERRAALLEETEKPWPTFTGWGNLNEDALAAEAEGLT